MIARLCLGLASRGRALFYRMRGVQIRGHVSLRSIEIPRYHAGVTLEAEVALDRGVVLLLTGEGARISIGPRCYINRQTMFDASGEITVGAETMIGPFCYITDHDHGARSGQRPSEGELITAPTRLGARCWIGAHVTVLKGVSIGDGSVVGAGSVVTKSIPAGVIAVGNPARVLKQVPA